MDDLFEAPRPASSEAYFAGFRTAGLMNQTTPPNLSALIAGRARTEPDKPILTFVTVTPDGGFADDTRTYRQLQENALALAGALQRLGLRQGQALAIMMHNRPEFVEAMIASSMLGAVFVPIDPRAMGEKLIHMLVLADCRGVLFADECLAALEALDPAAAPVRWAIAVGGSPALPGGGIVTYRYEPLIAEGCGPDALAAPDPAAPMFMMFTSGTTGAPKAVVQNHATYVAHAFGYGRMGIGEGDVLYTGLSLTHINAQSTVRGGLALGLPTIVSRKFTKSRLWDICRAYGCTAFTLLGGMIPEVFSAPPRPDDAENPVRLILSSGMPASLWRAYETRFGVQIAEAYGSTEGGGSLFNPAGVGPVGSIGKPPDHLEAAAFDETGQRCGRFEPGELRFRRRDGSDISIAYFKNAAAGRDKVRDGWFCTGDIVHQDEDGWFFFEHRVGGGVRINGAFVNTALVETVISRSGLVADVFVYGVRTSQNVAGEKTLVAAVTPATPSFNQAALLDHCRSHLERADVPTIVQVLDAIPKTMSEKPIEQACVELLRRSGAVSLE
jgi:crotonobetaine/carnitine-CoA ligase